jgi:hypothetical protein
VSRGLIVKKKQDTDLVEATALAHCSRLKKRHRCCIVCVNHCLSDPTISIPTTDTLSSAACSSCSWVRRGTVAAASRDMYPAANTLRLCRPISDVPELAVAAVMSVEAVTVSFMAPCVQWIWSRTHMFKLTLRALKMTTNSHHVQVDVERDRLYLVWMWTKEKKDQRAERDQRTHYFFTCFEAGEEKTPMDVRMTSPSFRTHGPISNGPIVLEFEGRSPTTTDDDHPTSGMLSNPS